MALTGPSILTGVSLGQADGGQSTGLPPSQLDPSPPPVSNPIHSTSPTLVPAGRTWDQRESTSALGAGRIRTPDS
jgi:hypothetical protein